MLACFAHKGWKVLGMDVNKVSVDMVNSGHFPIYEPGVEELTSSNRSLTEATYAVMNSDVSFIIVPTPSIEDGSFTTVIRTCRSSESRTEPQGTLKRHAHVCRLS